MPGVWVEPPQPGLLWTPGYWAFVGGLYAFHRGYWAHEVGFYGGVTDGFGYFGRGYDGGRWEGGNFFYNTAVNNIRTTNITTVYNNPVAVNNITNISNVSYNGGHGGIAAKPTAAEQRIASQPRIAPTPLQRDQIRAAAIRPEQFVSTNQGKPPIAATVRPADFKPNAVVPAKAAGTAQLPSNAQPLPKGISKEQEKRLAP